MKSCNLLIQRTIALLDRRLSQQVDAILHHARFQQLEASWRGLSHLVDQLTIEKAKRVKIRLLNLTWTELVRDVTRAVEFDQSQLFFKIYSNEFGHPGGEPFGLLLGDYKVSHQIKNDLIALQAIAKIAAAAFAPFIMAADATFFGLDDFSGLERPLNLEQTFQQTEYQQWKILREDEDARFIGLVMPRVLMRLPYQDQFSVRYPFCYSETTNFLWGNVAYCFAATVIQIFVRSGWFAEVQGGRHATINKKYKTEICITDKQEKKLSDLGFIALSRAKYTELNVFYACPSIQNPKLYNRETATENAQISSYLHYMLCVSRFAHYIKIIARDKIGAFSTPQECESKLQEWLHQYTSANSEINAELKIKYPLREARVHIKEKIGRPGNYICTIYLCPHYQFDQIESYVKLTTELVGGG